MVGGVPRSLKAKGPSKKKMGEAYEKTIKAVLEAVDDKQKGMVDQINRILGEFQSQVQQTLTGQGQNFFGAIQRALDIAYTGDVHLTVIRKFMFEKLGISPEEYNGAIEAEVKLRDEMRRRQIEEHNARLEAMKKAAEEQKATDNSAAEHVKIELGRIYAMGGVEGWEAQTTIQVQNGILSLECAGYIPVVGGAGFILEKLVGIKMFGELDSVLKELMPKPEPSPELGTVTEDNEPVMFGGDYQPEGKPVDREEIDPAKPTESIIEVMRNIDKPIDPDSKLAQAAKILSDGIIEAMNTPGPLQRLMEESEVPTAGDIHNELERLGVMSFTVNELGDGRIELEMWKHPRIVEKAEDLLAKLRAIQGVTDDRQGKKVYLALRGEDPGIGEIVVSRACPCDCPGNTTTEAGPDDGVVHVNEAVPAEWDLPSEMMGKIFAHRMYGALSRVGLKHCQLRRMGDYLEVHLSDGVDRVYWLHPNRVEDFILVLEGLPLNADPFSIRGKLAPFLAPTPEPPTTPS